MISIGNFHQDVRGWSHVFNPSSKTKESSPNFAYNVKRIPAI